MSTPMPPASWKNRIPTWLTLSRLFVTPFIMVCLFPHEQQALYGYIAAVLFILGSLTDWWDGYFARKFQVVSNFGKFMDPIADKIMVSSTLIMAIPSGRVDAVLVVVLIGRDILIGGVRSLAAIENMVIDARSSGKWKTAVQMIGIPAVLIREPIFGIPVHWIGYRLLWISVILSLFSATQYLHGYFSRTKMRF